jgi:hypothetical protein
LLFGVAPSQRTSLVSCVVRRRWCIGFHKHTRHGPPPVRRVAKQQSVNTSWFFQRGSPIRTRPCMRRPVHNLGPSDRDALVSRELNTKGGAFHLDKLTINGAHIPDALAVRSLTTQPLRVVLLLGNCASTSWRGCARPHIPSVCWWLVLVFSTEIYSFEIIFCRTFPARLG